MSTLVSVREKQTYLFETCNDSEWEAMTAQMEKLKANIKDRESFLKNIPENGIVNAQTGEFIMPPKRRVNEFLYIKYE